MPIAVEGTSVEPSASPILHLGEYWFDAIRPWHDHLILKHKEVIQTEEMTFPWADNRPGIGPGLRGEAAASCRAAVSDGATEACSWGGCMEPRTVRGMSTSAFSR